VVLALLGGLFLGALAAVGIGRLAGRVQGEDRNDGWFVDDSLPEREAADTSGRAPSDVLSLRR
jgi:hypothetical protein